MMSKISIVIPVYNEEAVIHETYRRVDRVLGIIAHEFIFVDDGSSDQTVEILHRLSSQDPAVKLVLFSRNFGHQMAVTAGVQYASGDAVVIMDADLQDPPEMILEFIRAWQDGYDVVYGVRRSRAGDGWFKKASAYLFYRILGMVSEVEIPKDTGDFRLMSRKVVDVINGMPEAHRFLRGMTSWVGFSQLGVEYDRAPRGAGATKYPLRKMIRLAVDAVTGFSLTPLKMGIRLAGLVGVVALMGSIWLIYQKLTNPQGLLLGWTSLMVTIIWLGAMQLFVIGIVAEYVGRVLVQVRNRPLYVIKKTVNFAGKVVRQNTVFDADVK